MPGTTPAIATERLTKDYGSGHGVFDLDLEAWPGEILGFLGPNGAGKSTTMRLLLGLATPTAGCARVLGHDVTTDGPDLRRRIGYLAGDFGLYPQVTGRALLRWFARLHGGVDDARIAAFADRFDAQLDRPVRDLSTGNRQKLGLIQAFMHDPEVLVLDEPIAGLDPLVQHRFHELLGELRAAGRTILLSSHTLSEVDRVADRVAILRDGRLVVVQALEALRAVALRRWELELPGAPDGDAARGELASLPGVREVAREGRHLHLAFEGSPEPVLAVLARHHVTDLRTREGDLEDVFLRYCRGDGPR